MNYWPPFDYPWLRGQRPAPASEGRRALGDERVIEHERVVEVRVAVPAFSAFTAEERTWAGRLIEAGYKILALEHHPDHGGATAAMQALNAVVAKLRAALEIEA